MRLGEPQRSFKTVHVAGSKGKGSVSSLVGRALMDAGARVGIYGSPHVESIRERIRLDGDPIGEASFARAMTRVLDAVETCEREGTSGAGASWFDIMTVGAFVAFEDAGADWAVLEVGLGGRLDSTNVIDAPVVSVVTTIALEHTQILGTTHAAIAREKAGIVKAGSTFVSGCDPASEAGVALGAIAVERGVEQHIAWDPQDRTFEAANVRVARAAIDALVRSEPLAVWTQPPTVTERTIEAARLPGRMEQRLSPKGVPVLFDGAHVAGSVDAALREGQENLGPAVVAVVAIHSDKDAEELLAPMAGRIAGVVATSVPSSGVHIPAAHVAEAATANGLDVAGIFDDPTAAFEAAEAYALHQGPDAWLFVTGSLYLIGALRGASSGVRKILPHSGEV